MVQSLVKTVQKLTLVSLDPFSKSTASTRHFCPSQDCPSIVSTVVLWLTPPSHLMDFKPAYHLAPLSPPPPRYHNSFFPLCQSVYSTHCCPPTLSRTNQIFPLPMTLLLLPSLWFADTVSRLQTWSYWNNLLMSSNVYNLCKSLTEKNPKKLNPGLLLSRRCVDLHTVMAILQRLHHVPENFDHRLSCEPQTI